MRLFLLLILGFIIGLALGAHAQQAAPLRPSDMATKRAEACSLATGHSACNSKRTDLPASREARIAIVDTGFIKQLGKKNVHLCKTGHYDFVVNKPGIHETNERHGTYIANIIAQELEGYNYCIVVYRVWNSEDEKEPLFVRVGHALDKAYSDKIIAVNYSLQGLMHSYTERAAFVKALSQGIKIFVAAGNDGKDLDQNCISYPPCYAYMPPGMIIVGAVTDSDPQAPASYSNYGGKINVWKFGSYIDPKLGIFERGTSFAAPRALSDYVRSLQDNP